MTRAVRGLGLLWLMWCVMAATAARQKQESGRQQDNLDTSSRQKRNVGQGRGGSSLQQLMNAVQSDDHVAISEQYVSFTPSTPAPEDINCWVEVPTTRTVGGRCIQLGRRGRGARNRPWACQAGLHLAIMSPDCHRFSVRASRRRNTPG